MSPRPTARLDAPVVSRTSESTRASNLLAGLLAELRRVDLLDLQERYVAQFDSGRSTSLHLFEHVHGDSRDRGQAMVDLNALYRRSGFVLGVNELPDFLPALLEYLSNRPAEEVHELIEDCAHIVRAVGERLLHGRSPYASVFAALLDLHGAAPLKAAIRKHDVRAEPTLDDEWEESPVEFGPNAAAHGAQQSRPQFIRFTPQR